MDAYFTVLRSIPRSISNCASLYDLWGLCNLQQLIFRRSPHLVKAICVRNMQSRHMQVYQLISGIKLSSFHLKKKSFFLLLVLDPLCSPMISQSVTNAEHADQVCLSIHWPSWIQVKCRAWLHAHGALFRLFLVWNEMTFQGENLMFPLVLTTPSIWLRN